MLFPGAATALGVVLFSVRLEKTQQINTPRHSFAPLPLAHEAAFFQTKGAQPLHRAVWWTLARATAGPAAAGSS